MLLSLLKNIGHAQYTLKVHIIIGKMENYIGRIWLALQGSHLVRHCWRRKSKLQHSTLPYKCSKVSKCWFGLINRAITYLAYVTLLLTDIRSVWRKICSETMTCQLTDNEIKSGHKLGQHYLILGLSGMDIQQNINGNLVLYGVWNVAKGKHILCAIFYFY